MAQAHYAEHDGKPFFDELVAFITRSPVLVMVVEGPENRRVGCNRRSDQPGRGRRPDHPRRPALAMRGRPRGASARTGGSPGQTRPVCPTGWGPEASRDAMRIATGAPERLRGTAPPQPDVVRRRHGVPVGAAAVRVPTGSGSADADRSGGTDRGRVGCRGPAGEGGGAGASGPRPSSPSPHFEGYPAVLVHLPEAGPAELGGADRGRRGVRVRRRSRPTGSGGRADGRARDGDGRVDGSGTGM